MKRLARVVGSIVLGAVAAAVPFASHAANGL